MTGREPAGTLDRDVIGTFGLVADSIDAAVEWADYEIAGGKPPRWVIRELSLRLETIARAARGEPVTP